MAFRRIKYGVEFDPGREERRESSGIGWIVVLVTVLASVSFVWIAIGRIFHRAEETDGREADTMQIVVAPEPPAEKSETAAATGPARPPPPDRKLVVSGFRDRPNNVKNLLLKLDAVAKTGDGAMQVATIEKLRSLPGEPVADIDADLVRRLGRLNMRWLVKERNAQWVSETTVRSGDSATRIAQENGSTLGSLRLLNPGLDADHLRPGMKLFVMNHPEFSLVIHKTLRTLDFNLNGKLFKRYYLPKDAPEIGMAPGRYETPANLRKYFRENSVGLSPDDAAEVDTFTPRWTTVIVSDS